MGDNSKNESGRRRLRVTYYDANGGAELIRWVLHVGGVEFEDRRIGGAEWAKIKPTTPLGKMPLLEHGDNTYFQMSSICKFAAMLTGLEGKSLDQKTRVDIILGLYYDDGAKRIGDAMMNRKSELVKELMEVQLPEFFRAAQDQLKLNGGKWVAGREMTAADVAVAELIFRLRDPDDICFRTFGVDRQRKSLTEKYPLLCDVADEVIKNKNLRKYLQTRGKL